MKSLKFKSCVGRHETEKMKEKNGQVDTSDWLRQFASEPRNFNGSFLKSYDHQLQIIHVCAGVSRKNGITELVQQRTHVMSF